MNPLHRGKWCGIAVLAGSLWAFQSAAQQSPDTVFLNGTILAVDDDFSVAQALAVTGNRISAVGSDDEMEALADFVVLDRDHMTIPADEIRDLNSVLTMVDGRIVYDAL